jgi:hypothetical protein
VKPSVVARIPQMPHMPQDDSGGAARRPGSRPTPGHLLLSAA